MTVGRSPAKFKQLDDESSESQDAWPTRGNIKMFFLDILTVNHIRFKRYRSSWIPFFSLFEDELVFTQSGFLNGSDSKSLSTPKSESINLLNPAPGLFKINVIKYDAQANLKHTSTKFTRDHPLDPPVSHMILLAITKFQPATTVVCLHRVNMDWNNIDRKTSENFLISQTVFLIVLYQLNFSCWKLNRTSNPFAWNTNKNSFWYHPFNF